MLMEMGELVGRSSRRPESELDWGGCQEIKPTHLGRPKFSICDGRGLVQVHWILLYACRKGSLQDIRERLLLFMVGRHGGCRKESHFLTLEPRPVVSSCHPCHPTLVVGTCGVLVARMCQSTNK